MTKKRNASPIGPSEKGPPEGAAAASLILTLYIAGHGKKATRAITNVKKICDEHLAGRYELEVIDIQLEPALARKEGIIASPTLIKKLPLPLRRMIGDMSNKEKLLAGIDIRPRSET